MLKQHLGRHAALSRRRARIVSAEHHAVELPRADLAELLGCVERKRSGGDLIAEQHGAQGLAKARGGGTATGGTLHALHGLIPSDRRRLDGRQRGIGSVEDR